MFGKKPSNNLVAQFSMEELKLEYDNMVAKLRIEVAAGDPDAVVAMEGEMKSFNPGRVARMVRLREAIVNSKGGVVLFERPLK